MFGTYNSSWRRQWRWTVFGIEALFNSCVILEETNLGAGKTNSYKRIAVGLEHRPLIK